jgi:GTPase
MVDQDFRVADVARTAGCSTLVILSKWDITTIDVEDIRPVLEERLRQRPTLVAVSAKSGRGVDRTLDRIAELFVRHTARIPTPELNDFLQELRAQRPGPTKPGKGRRLNLLYGTQIGVRPPKFKIFVNDPALMTRDYGYWVENRLRERFGLSGVPVMIDFARRA